MRRNLTWAINRTRQRIVGNIENPTLRRLILSFQKIIKGKSNISLDGSTFFENMPLDTFLNFFKKNGYIVAPYIIDDTEIESIMKHILNLKCNDPYRKHLGAINPTQAPPETHIAHYERYDLVKSKEIMGIANDPGVLNLVQDYLGVKPTISNVSMWWSFGNKEYAEEAQNFHRDNDDIKFCKLFVYLTDVGAQNGPHIYIKKTANSDKLTKVRRYTDDEVEAVFGKENILSMEYPKGSIFIVDTYGFHKGLLPEDGRRLLLQIQYSVNSIGYQDYRPIHVDYDHHFDFYTNRLLIK
jgi:hypothetical protein